MTRPQQPEPRPYVGQNITPSGNALMLSAFCMVCLAVLVWPIGRMWNQTPRDWEMILPAFAMAAILIGFAIAGIVRFMILSRRAGMSMVNPGRPAQRFNVHRLQQLGAETVDLNEPFLTGHMLTAPAQTVPVHDQVDVALAGPEPAAIELAETDIKELHEAFVYPDAPEALGEPFQRIMASIRALPEHPAVLARVNELYLAAAEDLAFRQAEAFVIRKAEKRPDFNPDAYAEPVDPENPALHLDLADQIHPYAATVAAMVLLSGELPERIWDLLAAPWEGAELDFPQVVLAG